MSLEKVDIPITSWLNFCQKEEIEQFNGSLLNKTKVSFFGAFEPPKLEPQDDDIDYIVKNGDRLDMLAYRFYETPLLWWVIALKNDIDLPSVELIEGLLVVIPSPRYVKNFILGNS